MASEADKPSASAAETIFIAALAIPTAERAAYLAGACGDDPRLRRRVEALLKAHEAPEGFLPEQSGTASSAASRLAPFATASLTERPGDCMGLYKLLEKIGEGGCGVVWMAQQEQPVRRKVALKIIKLGMDTRQVVARFEAERQALALMDHGNIAKVLDAGATETGRPYFVMELVGGIKITDYCEQKHLNTHQRLELFMQVCRAVQHAHQKGVIHRDLKPSNVLVAEQDGVAVPKVIDFGIAKATQGRLTDQTVFTAFEQFLGTPAYMSPEQAQLGGLDIDTRSDIYSLGVLLYELLTGKTPFDTKELLAAGLDVMRRTIQEKEPPTPSTRLKEQRRSTAPAGFGDSAVRTSHSAIDQDLDWIVMKCLEKDRARRYETTNGLVMDVQRHLNNEAVLAGRPSKLYRFQKLVQRNKLVFAAAGLSAGALVLGALGSTWEAVRATQAEREQVRLRRQAQQAQANEAREREKAQKEAVKSQQIAKFLEETLEGAGPSKALGRDTTMLKEILDKTSERVAKELHDQPLIAAELLNIIGGVYNGVNEFEKAESTYGQALKLSRSSGQDEEQTAVSLRGLAGTRAIQGDEREADTLYREALSLNRRLFKGDHKYIAASIFDLATRLEVQAKYEEADVLQQEALEMYRRLLGEQSAEVAWSLRALGNIRKNQGKVPEAELLYRNSLAIMRKTGNLEQIAWSAGALAAICADQGKCSEAVEAMKEQLEIQRRIYPKTNVFLRNSLLGLSHALARAGKPGEAEAPLREAIAIHQARPENERADADVAFWIGNELSKIGQFTEAVEWNRLAVASESKARNLPASKYASMVQVLVDLLVHEQKGSEVEANYWGWLEPVRSRQAPDSSAWASLLLANLASVMVDRGRFAEGEALARECLAIHERALPDDWLAFNARSVLGACLLGQKKLAQAETLLLSGYEGMKHRESKFPANASARLKKTILLLVSVNEMMERPDQVARWKTELTQWYRDEAARYRQPAELGDVVALNNLAWLLSTCEEPSVRDGPGAVAYAQKVVSATNRKEALALDTLAAAYAEAGDFTKAVSLQKEAILLAQNESLKKELEARLNLYQSNTPYRVEHDPVFPKTSL